MGGVMRPKKKPSAPTSGGKGGRMKKPPKVSQPKNRGYTSPKAIQKMGTQRAGRTMLSDSQGKGKLGG